MSARDIKTTQRKQSPVMAVFKPVTVLLLFIVGLMSFGAFITLSGFQGDLEKKDFTARAHVLSKSPNGFAGILRLLRSENTKVDISRGPEEGYGKRMGALTVITVPSTYSRDALQEFDRSGRVLIVLPKWRTRLSREEKGGVIKVGIEKTERLANLIDNLPGDIKVQQADGETPHGLNLDMRPVFDKPQDRALPDNLTPKLTIDRLQTLAGGNGKLMGIITTDEGDIVLARVSGSKTFILADPDLLNNNGLKSYEAAALGVDLLAYMKAEYGTIYFDLTLHGLGTNQNLVKTMLTPPFLAATLCLLATGLMLAWRAFTRFGRAKESLRVYALGKQVLADNSADLIRLAGREPNMAPGYAVLIRKLTARSVRVPKTLSETEVTATLDRIAERAKVDGKLKIMTQQAGGVTTIAGLLALAQKLDKWRQEMTHDRKSD